MQLQGVFVFLSALSATAATPLGRRCDGSGAGTPTTPSNGVSYVLPSTGGPTSLPSPDQPLKHIVVGHGVQNYTCTAIGAKGVSAGALAVLHDITSLYPGSGSGAVSPATWNSLTSKVLRTTDLPIDLSNPSSPFPEPADLTVSGISKPLPFLGHHFFDSNGVPTFSLNDDAELFKGQKVLGIPAPSTADKGLDSEGAVDWLYLADTGSSVGITKVYRVLTSGGNSAVCGAVGETQSVPYTTMYWLY
ncbi:putative malate dehydrogenase protein [Rosellinia necatrix]|uniref:Putative malate dehydrogenase protein n=1 Tax=Rosellinia necatrix TaxID=77044 RepID=A0A1W2TAK5_ROSNE|nr:putative malate dehydrogenase protein [Rosellinia necatrix]